MFPEFPVFIIFPSTPRSGSLHDTIPRWIHFSKTRWVWGLFFCAESPETWKSWSWSVDDSPAELAQDFNAVGGRNPPVDKWFIPFIPLLIRFQHVSTKVVQDFFHCISSNSSISLNSDHIMSSATPLTRMLLKFKNCEKCIAEKNMHGDPSGVPSHEKHPYPILWYWSFHKYSHGMGAMG